MKTKETASSADAIDSIFGKVGDGIFLPSHPYQVRFNCKAGQLAVSEDDFLGKEAEISILKVSRWFGELGRTRNTEWLQLFFVPAPGCSILPHNTVCCSYVKTRSLSQFSQVITRLLAAGENPAKGIFKVGFNRHSSGDREYYSVKWDWRERAGEAEGRQLLDIAGFMQSDPLLIDARAVAGMVPIDGMSQEELLLLIESSKQQQALAAAGA